MRIQNKGFFSQNFIVQNVGLLVAVLLVAFLYGTVIRPKARELEITNRLLQAESIETDYTPQRSIFIILKDFEQQACLTLMVWAVIILSYKLYLVAQESKLLRIKFIQIEEGERIIPADALDHYREVEGVVNRNESWRDRLLPEVLSIGLHRFHSTNAIQDVVSAVRERTDLAAEQLDSDLSLVRYIAWAIPSVGFIGTVRGIGEALGQAERAIQGDIEGVTSALGLAFNSTFVALLLSIGLMFIMHMLQSRQEGFVLEVENYCREKLIGVMKIPVRQDKLLPFA
jgi:biopolymer transport protein ExbB/TolQ